MLLSPKFLQSQNLLRVSVVDLTRIFRCHSKFADIGRESYFWKMKTCIDFQRPKLSFHTDVDWKRVYYLNNKFISNPSLSWSDYGVYEVDSEPAARSFVEYFASWDLSTIVESMTSVIVPKRVLPKCSWTLLISG